MLVPAARSLVLPYFLLPVGVAKGSSAALMDVWLFAQERLLEEEKLNVKMLLEKTSIGPRVACCSALLGTRSDCVVSMVDRR